MNRDPNRAARPDAGGERHTVSVTRMCLRSGSVQLPFALSGRLPQGELLVHEAERDEPMMLWSEPPRTLSGLGPLFERYEIQVNDQLVLDLQGDDLRLSVRKRPRRSRPQVTPSTWASHRAPDGPLPEERKTFDDGDDRPGSDGDWSGRDDDERTGHGASRHAAGASDERFEDDAAGFGDFGRGQDPEGARAAEDPYGAPHESPYGEDDDAPRAPRVRVSPLPRNATTSARDAGTRRNARPSSGGDEAGRAERRTPREGSGGGGVFGGAWRAAKGWFTRGGGGGGRDETFTSPEEAEPDWVHAWDAGPDELERDEDARVETAYDDEQDRSPAPPASPWRPGRDAPTASRPPEPRTDTHGTVVSSPARDLPRDVDEPDEVDGPAVAETEARPAAPSGPRPDPFAASSGWDEAPDDSATDVRIDPAELDEGEAGEDEDDDVLAGAPRPAETSTEPGVVAADLDDGPVPAAAEDDRDVEDEEASRRATVERAAAWRHEGGVPSRAERFLAGDLRTRLLRFLTSPDMPLIAKTELIASRFDLPSDVAREMLEDIADDPPPGFRLTPVRDGAWRIERTGT